MKDVASKTFGIIAVIISAVVAAAACALLFPVKEAEADA